MVISPPKLIASATHTHRPDFTSLSISMCGWMAWLQPLCQIWSVSPIGVIRAASLLAHTFISTRRMHIASIHSYVRFLLSANVLPVLGSTCFCQRSIQSDRPLHSFPPHGTLPGSTWLCSLLALFRRRNQPGFQCKPTVFLGTRLEMTNKKRTG